MQRQTGQSQSSFSMFYLKTWLISSNIAAYLVFTVFSILPIPNLATNRATYEPPRGNVRRQVRKAGGSRGCYLPLNNIVTLLVPQDHIATTVSKHPIFLWHLSQELSLPLRFTLLEPGKKPIFVKELKPEPGIVALRLPQSNQPLEIGKTYRWTVTIVCNKKRPSRNLFAQAWIKRIPSSNKFSENANNTSSCSINYARAGIWYDALSCNYAKLVQNQNQTNSDSQAFWFLLTQIGLQNLAQPKPRLSLY